MSETSWCLWRLSSCTSCWSASSWRSASTRSWFAFRVDSKTTFSACFSARPIQSSRICWIAVRAFLSSSSPCCIRCSSRSFLAKASRRRAFSRTKSSMSPATSSRNLSTSPGSKPRKRSGNCCCRISRAVTFIPTTSLHKPVWHRSSQTDRNPLQRGYKKLVEKVYGQNDDQRREVDAKATSGQLASDWLQHRLSCPIEKLHDGIIGIRRDPRNYRPRDDDPHVKPERIVENKRNGSKEIPKYEHPVFLFLVSGERPLAHRRRRHVLSMSGMDGSPAQVPFPEPVSETTGQVRGTAV